jgi:hypothetical protein
MTSISSSSNLEIKNDKWTVGELLKNKKNIIKPKFQRKKWWTIHPVQNGKAKPNYKDYIDFLYKTKNTIDPISFGAEIKSIKGKNETIYINVDGNNRINAIITFLETPLLIYPEYLKPLITLLDKTIETYKITEVERDKFIDFIKSLNYHTITRLTQFKCLYEKEDEIKLILEKICQKIDDYNNVDTEFFNIKKELLLDNADNFDQTVIININIFKEATFEELCMIFQSINRHNHCLSETELLASTLVEKYIQIENNDTVITHGVIKAIKDYYATKQENEALTSSEFDETKINSFDIMVGLQNYCSIISDKVVPAVIPSDDISLYFKIYRQLHNSESKIDGLQPTNFTQYNINTFISNIIQSVEIINSSINKIFNDKINERLFNKSCKSKTSLLGKNNLFIIIISIIVDLKNNKNVQEIINYTTRCILYHLLLKDIKDIENITLYTNSDIFHYEAGGGYIEAQATKIMKGELDTSQKITKEIFTEVVTIIIEQNNEPVILKNKKTTRRKLKFIDHCLTSFYYNKYVSNIYLDDNKYSIEHIIPFSSSWEDIEEIDIDRIGNLIPIIDSLNKGRSNSHIDYYEKTDSTFVSLLKNIPNKATYDTIVNHDSRKPKIINVENYNKMCEENEKKYLENFIKQCFPKKK